MVLLSSSRAELIKRGIIREGEAMSPYRRPAGEVVLELDDAARLAAAARVALARAGIPDRDLDQPQAPRDMRAQRRS